MNPFGQPVEWEDIDSILRPEDDYEWIVVDEQPAWVAMVAAVAMLLVALGALAFVVWLVR